MNRKPWRWPLAVAAVLIAALALTACGGDDDDDDTNATATTGPQGSAIEIVDPWARETPNDVTAAYMVIKNSGGADRLLSATSSLSSTVQIHETVTEGSSMRMQEVEGGVEVPAGGEVHLKPGGYHIMVMSLAEPVEAGDIVDLELTFEKAGVIEVEAPVRAMEGMTQGGMQHGGMANPSPTAGD